MAESQLHVTADRTQAREGKWIQAVVKVGSGRGFVVETDREDRFIITAAHCLPHLPEPHAYAIEERVYPKLIGPLAAEPTLWAECVFLDLVADIAVLCSPGERIYEEEDECEAFLEAAAALPIGGLAYSRRTHTLPGGGPFGGTFLGPPEAESEARLLSLDGHWFPCKVKSRGRGLWIEDAAEGIRGSMSGSPIVTPEGAAIGMFCISSGKGLGEHREGGPNPELSAHLPVWLAKALDYRQQRKGDRHSPEGA